MGTHMKTTIEISDAILEQARRLAARDNTTLRALVEQGLHQVLTARKTGAKFKLRDASFRGNGLQSQAQSANWERLREMAYEGHGG
jgi:hypothetical protein